MYKKYKMTVVLLLFLFKQTASLAQPADLIFTNGKIFTSDTSQLYAEALAIKGNRILAVGSNTSIEKLASSKTKKIDLQGRTVVPGFNDAHDHLAWLIPVGQSFFTPFSVPGPSKEEVIDSLLRLLKKASPNQWIQGTIGLTVFHDPAVRRSLLDSLAPNNPVALQILWGHGMILNSKALKAVGISDTAADPLSGWYERKPGTKYVTGALYEGAQFPVWQAITVAEPANTIKALRAHGADELAFGITTVQNMSSTLQGNAARRFFGEAKLPVRTRIIAMPGTSEKGRSLQEWNNDTAQITKYTYTTGIKYVIDGTSLEQTALMTKPYANRSNWYGRLNFPVDTIRQILKEALTSKRQLMLHIVGDSATKIILGLMKELASDAEWKQRRVRIEHGVGITTDGAAKDVRDMGIVIVHTPQYGMTTSLHDWVSMSIPVAVGPDDVINPFLAILTMTTQQKNPKQNLTREQAVIAYTKGSAYAEFAEKEKGTLAKGMLADLTVLSQDIFTVPAQKLPASYSLMTVVDGKIVYKGSEGLNKPN